MKKGATLNAEKLNLWQCCGQYLCSGVAVCPICGKSRPDGNSGEPSHTELERSQPDALDAKGTLAEILPKFAGRFRITIERHGPRTLDGDNFVGGCKQLRDAIAELLGKKGDSEADGLDFRYVQVKSTVKKTVLKIQQIME